VKLLALPFAVLAGPALADGPVATACGSASHCGGFGLGVTLGFGGQAQPAYFGSDEYVAGVTGSFGFGYLDTPYGSLGRGDPNGLGFKGAFRLIGERNSDDYNELAGLDDVNAALEIGGGLTFTDNTDGLDDNWGSSSFAELRYGAIGHSTWVAEIGSDLIYAPNPALTLTLGPRLFGGTDDYAGTYFGITEDESGASAFPAYTAGGGALSRALKASASYTVNDIWGVTGTVTYEEFINDAAQSPIVQNGSADQLSASVVITRSFSF